MSALEPAWVQDAYGGAETVRRAERAMRPPGPGEVRVRVEAVSLNAADRHLMRGDPLLVRPFFGITRPREPVRGRDLAGVVVEIGADVRATRVGDRVVGEIPGALAGSVTAPEASFAAVPDEVGLDIAATLPIAAGTARLAVRAAGAVPGARILVLGAGGGVGTFAVQLAVAAGASVDATCGQSACETVRTLGARDVVDYLTVPLSSFGAGRYDGVVDIAGTASLRDLRALVRPRGAVALVGGEGSRILGPIPRLLGALVSTLFSSRRLRPIAATTDVDATRELLDLAARGILRPVIDGRHPFDAADVALARIDGGHAVGKILVTDLE